MTRTAMCFVVLTLAACPRGVARQTSGASIQVDVSRPGIRISPSLYGIFFEEINHAGDGGLYAELVRNRSFEDDAKPVGWDASDAEIEVASADPASSENPHVLRFTPRGLNSTLTNVGFWGMGVQVRQPYHLSFWARRAEGPPGVFAAALERANGEVLAHEPIEITKDWKRHACVFYPSATESKARLVFSQSFPSTLLIDSVSLTPANTFNRRRGGLRGDLAQKLDDMHPAFLRFPGGCYCEGEVLKDAFRWKDSIGPVEKRPGHWNLWGYRSTDGLGYHEYLQLCEDLKSEPLFVINCGMSHREHAPLDQLDPWVQDALDAIEYANGPVTSKWGALRAKAGHPKPFNMKYIEIGNENGWGNTLAAYEARYARFHDAIKGPYPEMKLVANVPIRNRPMDIVDDHYYNNPEWFISNSGKYDNYDRKGPRVYVGEYAVTQGCGMGNLRAALAEAAFMMGLERNSDVVTLSSYAPLFVNVNDRKWNPDAICFDSSRSYGTPSYWVQQLFSRNRPDVNLPLQLTCPTVQSARPQGRIGLGTWATQAEFKGLSVMQGDQALYAPTLGLGRSGWTVFKGDWQATEGTYRQIALGTDMRSTTGDPNWSQFTYSLKARKISGAEGFLIMFHARDDGNYYWWNIGGWGNSRHAIEKAVNGSKTIVGNDVPGRVETGRWYDIRIEVDGARIKCYLDGKLIHNVEDRGRPAMTGIAGWIERKGEVVLKVANTSDTAQITEIKLDGASRISSEAASIVLTSASPLDENSLDNPTKIVPVTTRIKSVGAQFRHTFPPNSLTILRIKSGPR